MPVKFREVLISSQEFARVIDGKFNNYSYNRLIDGLSNCKIGRLVYWDWPMSDVIIDLLLFNNSPLYIGKEYVTVQHLHNKRKWIITSWGKFFQRKMTQTRHLF